MSARRKVEVFSAGCPACKETIELVNRVACPSCEVTSEQESSGRDGKLFSAERNQLEVETE